MSLTLSLVRDLWRRPTRRQWSRIERELPGAALPTHLLGLEDRDTADTSELRHYLAAQTSQVV